MQNGRHDEKTVGAPDQPSEQVRQEMRANLERALPMFAELGRVAGFVPPDSLTAEFERLHRNVVGENVPALAHLSNPRPGGPDWLARFRVAILDSLQEGLYAASYHLSRVESIETAMLHIAEAHLPLFGPSLAGSSIGGGNSRALNFEYQAFAFALRRTLEYLSVAIGAYFKAESHSFRDLAATIARADPREKVGQVQRVLAEHAELIQDILPTDKHNDRSLRDRLAHWEAVSAGVFNVIRGPTGYQIGIFGGGHNLTPSREAPDHTQTVLYEALGPALRGEFERVRSLMWACIGALGLG
jgi:hypothetical protein